MVDLRILSDEDKNLVHRESLKILEQTGVSLESREALNMLKSKGCVVDFEACTVKFPSQLVENALETAPKKFILGGLDPKNDMRLGEGNVYIATDGQACFTYDAEKGERRETVMKDLIDAARICDKLDYLHCFWPIVSAGDVPVEIRTLCELVRGYKVICKPKPCNNFRNGRGGGNNSVNPRRVVIEFTARGIFCRTTEQQKKKNYCYTKHIFAVHLFSNNLF